MTANEEANDPAIATHEHSGHSHNCRAQLENAKLAAEQEKLRLLIAKKKAAEQKCSRLYESSRAYRIWAGIRRKAWRLMQIIGEDWLLLILTGIVVGLLSFSLDWFASMAYRGRMYALEAATFSMPLQYFTWVFYHAGFCMVAVGIVQVINPQASGTGFPELKALLGGIELKGFLSWSSLATKYVGGCAAMCSGLPLGKGAILACLASCVSHVLSRRFLVFKGVYENESRKIELVGAAVAVGIACTFSCPVSGVLFAIELTGTHFEIQSYWRAFLCSICGTAVYRILTVLLRYELTIGALISNRLHLAAFPFDVVEFGAFTVLGIAAGLLSAAFVLLHRSLILFVRKRKTISAFLQKNRLLYPFVVSLAIASLTFPPLLGQFSAGRMTFRQTLSHLFFDKSLPAQEDDVASHLEENIRDTWVHPDAGALGVFASYFVVLFFTSALTFTLAMPYGAILNVLVMGAVLGRLVGEAMALWFPQGINAGYGVYNIVPGGYAVVGAAAMGGGVFHAMSMALVAQEMTGQVHYLIPALWATIIANVVAKALMFSLFDSVIQMKNIPFLPVFKQPSSRTHQILAADIMLTDFKYFHSSSTYEDVKNILINNPFIRSYPLVDTIETMQLIGSVQRNELIDALERHVKSDKVQSAGSGDPALPKRSALKNASAKNKAFAKESKDCDQSATEAHGCSAGTSTLHRCSQDSDPLLDHKDRCTKKDACTTNNNEEKLRREEEMLKVIIRYSDMRVDPAPFQLSEKTSLHKVHSLFVLLRLSQAYVTSFGRLVGVVTIKEIQRELGHPSLHEGPRSAKLFRKTKSATIGGGDRGMPILLGGEQ